MTAAQEQSRFPSEDRLARIETRPTLLIVMTSLNLTVTGAVFWRVFAR